MKTPRERYLKSLQSWQTHLSCHGNATHERALLGHSAGWHRGSAVWNYGLAQSVQSEPRRSAAHLDRLTPTCYSSISALIDCRRHPFPRSRLQRPWLLTRPPRSALAHSYCRFLHQGMWHWCCCGCCCCCCCCCCCSCVAPRLCCGEDGLCEVIWAVLWMSESLPDHGRRSWQRQMVRVNSLTPSWRLC